MTIVIYHNPRCSKSLQALTLLQEQGIEPIIIDYLKTPPSRAELIELLMQLQFQPRELMRRNESSYKEGNLDNPELDRLALIDAIIANPILLQRPIVVANNKAAIGRPPEAVLGIL